jgi:hypothetical protein
MANRRKQNTRFVRFLNHNIYIYISANYIDVEEEYRLGSGHSRVILTLNETIVRKEANPTKKLNSVVLVRKRTIPTKRPQPADEVSANFS